MRGLALGAFRELSDFFGKIFEGFAHEGALKTPGWPNSLMA
jgi:hypothetical protein